MTDAREVIATTLFLRGTQADWYGRHKEEAEQDADSVLQALEREGWVVVRKQSEVICKVCGKLYANCTHLYVPDEITLDPPKPAASQSAATPETHPRKSR